MLMQSHYHMHVYFQKLSVVVVCIVPSLMSPKGYSYIVRGTDKTSASYVLKD